MLNIRIWSYNSYNDKRKATVSGVHYCRIAFNDGVSIQYWKKSHELLKVWAQYQQDDNVEVFAKFVNSSV